LTPGEILVAAYKRGRSWNPAYPNLLNLDEAAVKKMTGAESDAKLLVKSLQESDANFDPIVLAYHKRLPTFDGGIGPATEALVDLPRCPLPDFPPPPHASFHYDDPGLQKAVETMQANATGSGSWPACDPDAAGRPHSFRVRIANPERMPTNWSRYKNEIFKAVTDCYAEIGCALRYIFGDVGDCEILKLYQALVGSVIGWNEFPSANTCNQTINGRLDTGYDPSDWRYQANLETHETGHGVGLQHTRGHIMNPSILLIWPMTWRGGPSESTMKRYFGGEPITPPSPPPPPPGPPTDVPQIADLQVTVGGRKISYEVRPRIVTVPPIEV